MTPALTVAVWALFRSSRRLEQEQWLSAEELAVRRRARLQQLLLQANAASYYRAAIRDAGIQDPGRVELRELETLPFLDREVIAQHGLQAFLTGGEGGLFGITTSGSTGTPGLFLRSKREEAEFSARWRRVYAAFGCRVLDAQVNVAGAGRPGRPGPINLLRQLGVLPRIELIAATTPPEQVLKRVQALQPRILTGYAGAIEALAEHVLATGARIRPPSAVFCTAMEVTEHSLAMAERAFQAPAVDVYVTNELGVIAWSCPLRGDRLHVNDDALVVEVVGPDGTPVTPETLGEMVVTSLGLTSMPLIRYRTGDLAAFLPEPCQCGRGLGVLTRVQGRTAHAIRGPGGVVITTPVITNLFGKARAYEWVRRFQVREEPGHRLRFLLDARQPPTERQRELLAQQLESNLGPAFQVVLELVDQIPAAPSGKLQFLVPLNPD